MSAAEGLPGAGGGWGLTVGTGGVAVTAGATGEATPGGSAFAALGRSTGLAGFADSGGPGGGVVPPASPVSSSRFGFCSGVALTFGSSFTFAVRSWCAVGAYAALTLGSSFTFADRESFASGLVVFVVAVATLGFVVVTATAGELGLDGDAARWTAGGGGGAGGGKAAGDVTTGAACGCGVGSPSGVGCRVFGLTPVVAA